MAIDPLNGPQAELPLENHPFLHAIATALGYVWSAITFIPLLLCSLVAKVCQAAADPFSKTPEEAEPLTKRAISEDPVQPDLTKVFDSTIILNGPEEVLPEEEGLRFEAGEFNFFCLKNEPIVDDEVLQQMQGSFHFVKDDGSCWSRAYWLCIFSQIFDDEEKFNSFIAKISHPQEAYDIPSHLAKNTIHILHQLKGMSESERIDYLCHKNVSETLISFMRHVAAESLKNNFNATDQEVARIKEDMHYYGASEMDAFACYFHLEVHTIARDNNGEGEWTYYKSSYNQGKHTSEIISAKEIIGKSIKIPYTCLYASHDAHFDTISFGLSEQQPQSTIDATRKPTAVESAKENKIAESAGTIGPLTRLSPSDYFEFNPAINMSQKEVRDLVAMNPDKLNEKPTPFINIDEKIAEYEILEIKVEELVEIYNNSKELLKVSYKSDTFPRVFNSTYKLYKLDPDDPLIQAVITLQTACILMLKDDNFSPEKKIKILNALYATGNTCTEERHTILTELLENLFDGTGESLQETVKIEMRRIKREILKSCYNDKDSQGFENMHVHNRLYTLVGSELGLDIPPEDDLKPDLITLSGIKHDSKEEVLNEFNTAYTPDRVIDMLGKSLNEKMQKTGYGYLKLNISELIRNRLIRENAFGPLNDYVDKLNESQDTSIDENAFIMQPYIGELAPGEADEKAYITDRGVAILLVELGIFTENLS